MEATKKKKMAIVGIIVLIVVGIICIAVSISSNSVSGKYVGTRSNNSITCETVINLTSNGKYTLTVTQLQNGTVRLSSSGTYKTVGENDAIIIFTEVGGITFQAEFKVNIHGQRFISLSNSGIAGSNSVVATACYKS